MQFNEEETANVIASYLHSMYVEEKEKAIDVSTQETLTVEQFAADRICEDLVNRGAVGVGSEEQKNQLKRDVFKIIDLMYIHDKEKYRSPAVERHEQFEIMVAKAVVGVLRRKWIGGGG